MNGKTLFTACLTALLSLSGCALFQKTPAEQNTVQADANAQICPGGVCETDPFINYTQTRADYRAYGELSERDITVSEAGAGNNLSAAIPPSVENEVIEYEEQVENAALEDESQVEETLPETTVTENVDTVQNPADTLPENVHEDLNSSSDVSATSTETVAVQQPVAETTPAVATSITGNAEPVVENVSTESENTAVTENTLPAENTVPAETTVTENEIVADNVATDEETVTQEEENKNNEEEQEEDEEDPVRDWYAEEGQNLKALLTEWSNESGWRIVWNTNRNYVLNAGAMFRGRFADVSSALIRAFARARPAPVATFYKGNRVLVVETMEDENAYD